MIKVCMPIEGFKEIEQRGKNVFFYRTDVVKNEEEGTLECSESGVLLQGVPTYAKLVAAVVTDKYTVDAQIAMLANKGDGDEGHEQALAEFEAWRAEAKRLAHVIFPETGAEAEAEAEPVTEETEEGDAEEQAE